MDFDAWTTRSVDRQRQRRLFAGYLIGLAIVGSVGTALAFHSGPAPVEEEEENILNAQFADEPEPEAPEPEPEPEPQEPPPPSPRPDVPAPVLPELVTPDEIPDDAPEEKEPTQGADEGTDPYASGAPRGPAPRPTAPKVVAPVAPPKVQAPSGPVRITSETTPPKQLSAPPEFYPAAAKAAAIDGTVIVRYVVGVDGNPEQVQAIRGPEELRSACEDVVKGSRYEPAKDKKTGKAVSVYHHKKCTYRLKT